MVPNQHSRRPELSITCRIGPKGTRALLATQRVPTEVPQPCLGGTTSSSHSVLSFSTNYLQFWCWFGWCGHPSTAIEGNQAIMGVGAICLPGLQSWSTSQSPWTLGWMHSTVSLSSLPLKVAECGAESTLRGIMKTVLPTDCYSCAPPFTTLSII